MAMTVVTSTIFGTLHTYRKPLTFEKLGKRWYANIPTRNGVKTVPVKYITSVKTK